MTLEAKRAGLDRLPHLPEPSRIIETTAPEYKIAVWDIKRGSRKLYVITIGHCEVNYQHRILHEGGKPLVDEHGKIAVISSKKGVGRKFRYNPYSEYLIKVYDRLRNHSTNGSNQNHR